MPRDCRWTWCGRTVIHPTPSGPRYATRKDFVYGEDITTGEWTVPTAGLPRYAPEAQQGG
ncbi:hypothetical protein GCM10018966_086550 [Streptomyces yanii]